MAQMIQMIQTRRQWPKHGANDQHMVQVIQTFICIVPACDVHNPL